MPEIVLTLLEHAADIVVLTEWRNHIGGQINGILADHGLRHQAHTNPPKGVNGVLIASRVPFDTPATEQSSSWFGNPGSRPSRSGLASHDRARSRRFLEVELAELPLRIIGVHVPCDGTGLGREAVFQEAVSAARRAKDGNCVLIGDLNAGRHFLDEEGATFTCTRLLGEIATMGYADAWRMLHPSDREYSWFSHEGSGFRIDHAFVSAPLREHVKCCEYSHNERENDLSDHSLMVVEIDIPGRKCRKNGEKTE